MSSWQYAFLFPPKRNKLRPELGIDALITLGFIFDDKIRLCLPIDDNDHWLDIGEQIPITSLTDLRHYFEQPKSISIQARSPDITVACHFLLESQNPNISFGWPRGLFAEMSSLSQRLFWDAIRGFSRGCGAAYVIIIDDAPDEFEDRFVQVDDERMLDMHVNHDYGLGVREIWLQSSFNVALPEGPAYEEKPLMIGDGFKCFKVI